MISNPKKLKRVAGYVTGGILIFLGIMGLLIESSKGKPSATHFYGYVLAAMFFVCGVLTCVGVWRCYAGGLWSFFGLLFIVAGIARLTSLSEALARGRHLISPGVFYSLTAVLFCMGFYGLSWGHLRRHRLRKSDLHDAG
jgi:hypothetical protein